MYCAFYRITEKPFSITPDPRFLYLGATHKEAFAHLLYGIRERGGFIVVTGEIGTGKTTLCRGLLSHLDQDTLVAYIFNPTLSAMELLKSINEDFGIDSVGRTKKELIDELNRFLLEKRKEGKNTVLIIDEAQNLDGEVLEQIRLLSNLETETEKLLQIILIGQPEFRRILERPELLQLNQRVTVRYHLHALSAEETGEYVRHRLSVVDAEENIFFTPAAMRRIWRYTKGIPRLINVLCDRALLAGYSLRKKEIGGPIIDKAYREVSGGSTWGRPSRFSIPPVLRRWARPAAILAVLAVLLGTSLSFLPGRTAKDTTGEGGQGGAGPGSPPAVADSGGGGGEKQAVSAPVKESGGDAAEERKAPVLADAGVTEEAKPAVLPEVEDVEASPVVAGGGETAREGGVGPGEAEGGARSGASRAAASTAGAVVGAGSEILEAAFVRTFSSMSLLESREKAFLAVVERWGLPISGEQQRGIYRREPDLYKAAEALGFRFLRLRGNLNRIRAVNLPALLELRVGNRMEKRYLALLGFEGHAARIAPPLADGRDLVPVDLLESFWYGTAYVLWKDLWGGQKMFAEGARGEAVRWLQTSLRDLGYFRGKVTGVFDGETAEAVRKLQRDHYLDEDGILGPQTKIVLYRLVNGYPMPGLTGGS